MAMKIVLMVIIIVMALGDVRGQHCKNRRTRKIHAHMHSDARCNNPHMSLVPLTVPDGYDYVQPSVVKLNQCTGLACSVYPERCLPVPGNVTWYSYQVYAKKRTGGNLHCVSVMAEEHGSCECRCDPIRCPTNQVFNEETCDCRCDPGQRLACKTRRQKQREPVMWSQDMCSCVCDHRYECDSSSVWDSSVCQCIKL